MTKEFDRSFAVVIGINDYQNGIDTLQTAIPDAFAIAEILDKSYKYKLVHPDFDSGVIVNQYATKDKLRTLLTDILPNKIQPTEGELVATLPHQGDVSSAQFSPDGHIVTASDNTAKLWTSEGDLVATLPHWGFIRSVQFSPDGQSIVTASFDGTARLWKVENFNLNYMLSHACQEIRDYLKHNAEEADRSLCDGIALAEEETELAR